MIRTKSLMMKRSLQAVPAVHTVVKYDNLDNMFHEIAYQKLSDM